MRIGVDASNLRQGGGQTHLVQLLSAAVPQDHKISSVVVWADLKTLDLLPQREWLEKRLISPHCQRIPFRYWWQTWQLPRELKRTGCQILFAPGGNVPSSFRPCVTMCRNMLPFTPKERHRYGLSAIGLRLLLLRYLQACTFRRSDGVIFLTCHAKRAVTASIRGCSGQVAVIPHGTVQHASASSCTTVADSRNPGMLRVLYVSIVDWYKHQWHVVDAMAQVRAATGATVQLDLVGPAYQPALKRLRHALSRFDRDGTWARYVGPLSRSELSRHYAQSDIGVFASSCENMPNILLEMMASGLPIIASDRGPMPEILGDAGLLCNPEDPRSIAEGLRRLVVDEHLRACMSARSLEKVQTFTWARCANETFRFIRQIVDNHSSKGVTPCAGLPGC